MIKYLGGISLGILLCVGNGFSYTSYVTGIDATNYPFLGDVCVLAADNSVVCDTDMQKIVDNFEENIQDIRILIDSADVFWQPRLLVHLSKFSHILEEKEKQYTGETVLFVMQYMRFVFDDILLEYAEDKATIRIDANEFAFLKEQADSSWEFSQLLRRAIISDLVDVGFTSFVSKPYDDGDGAITTNAIDWEKYLIEEEVYGRDMLDTMLYDMARDDALEEVIVSPEVRSSRSDIYLFKNKTDLQALGYEIISHRTRINEDKGYRRENIARAFNYIGHVRVLNPGQTLSYLIDSEFDPEEQSKYLEGKSIFLDEEVDEYGGGLCGGSTAIYQGTFLNTGLDFVARNHSKWYSSLYTATINGKEQIVPGIDSTIYSPYLDLKVTNIRSYPMIVVMNYDGALGGTEEIMTLSPNKNDRGTYYVSEVTPRTFELRQGGVSGTGTRSVQGGCYTRYVHGKEKVSCYKEIF